MRGRRAWDPGTCDALCLWRRIQGAAMTAINKVNHKTDDEPDKKTNPIFEGEAGHENQARQNRQNGKKGNQGNAETALARGLGLAQDKNGYGDEDEGEQRADVGEIGERANVEDARGDADDDACNPGGEVWCAKALVNL